MLGLFRARKKTSPAKILVIGDEPDFVSIVEYRLKLVHYAVVTASDGKAGLELAVAEKPDLILLDTNVPATHGQEMLERFRADPTLKHIPVVVIVARQEEDLGPSAWGVSDCVTKPFDFGQLVDRIQAALESAKRRQDVANVVTGRKDERFS